jgi:predicted nucleic acid-binding protein
MIHLDTSFLIRSLVAGSREDARLRRWLSDGQPLGISAIAWSEFLCGPVRPEAVDLASRIVAAPVAFTADGAHLAARLFNLSGRRRGSFVDCMVAAVTLGAEALLATSNPGDFSRLAPAGLELAQI